MRLKDFMEKAEADRLPKLELTVADMRKQLDFLMDNTLIPRCA
jgi:hypothetical protein